MRDLARIDRILDAVRKVWTKYPDLRLGQLIVNAIRPSQPTPQVFYAEDDFVERGLSNYPLGDRPMFESGEVTLELTLSEAVVLFEFVNRFSDKDKLTLEDPAEAQVLYNLCCLLEKQDKWLAKPHGAEWQILLEQARRAVRPAE